MRKHIDQPVGQCIVKESWPIERPDERTLFVMLKLPPNTRSDSGWTYGQVSPQGVVHEAGQITSCMACHRRALRDRIIEPSRPVLTSRRELGADGWRRRH
jgi:hypothetical protein